MRMLLVGNLAPDLDIAVEVCVIPSNFFAHRLDAPRMGMVG